MLASLMHAMLASPMHAMPASPMPASCRRCHPDETGTFPALKAPAAKQTPSEPIIAITALSPEHRRDIKTARLPAGRFAFGPVHTPGLPPAMPGVHELIPPINSQYSLPIPYPFLTPTLPLPWGCFACKKGPESATARDPDFSAKNRDTKRTIGKPGADFGWPPT